MQLLALPKVVITEKAATAALPEMIIRSLFIRNTSTTPVPMLKTDGIALLKSSATLESFRLLNENLKMLFLEKKYQMAISRAT